VMVDEPTSSGSHYGGTVAAPGAASILAHSIERVRRLDHSITIRPEEDLPIRLR